MKIGDKRSAEKVAAAVRRKLAKGQFEIEPKKKTPTFGEYSKKWLLGYVQTNLRQSTYEEYFGILKNHVLPAFKSKRIDSINRGDVRDFPLSKHVDGLSQKRVMLFKDVMSGVLGYALERS